MPVQKKAWKLIECTSYIYIYIYIYEEDLALNNLLGLICYKCKRVNPPPCRFLCFYSPCQSFVPPPQWSTWTSLRSLVLIYRQSSQLGIYNTPTASLQRFCRPPHTTPPHTMCILNMILNYLIVGLQPWTFREYGVLLHCHHSQVHSDPEW